MSPIKALFSHSNPLFKQFIFPALFSLGVFWLMFWTYYLSWNVDNRLLHFLLTDVVGALFGFFLMFNVLFVYPLLYFKGASSTQRMTGSFLITLFWCLKEFYRMTEFYTLGESAFFLLFPIQANIILMSFGFMGLSELACRCITRKYRKIELKVLTPLPLSIVIIVLGIVIFTLHDGGVTYFFLYNDLYKFFFM